jgi:MFS family permease
LLASITVFFLASSSAPTPLYAVYQARWGFSPITTTVVFGSYALAVLCSLLTVGSLSDHVGRRPVLLAAISLQAATMLVFATADGVPALLLARVTQGLATGAALGAVGAGLLDLNRARGTIANSVAPLTGTGLGAIGSGLLVQYLPAPTHLVYLVLAAVFVAQAAGVAMMSETSLPRPGALASLRIQVGVPTVLRRPVLAAIPVLAALWALAGFYGSLAPALVRTVSGSQSVVLGGLGFALLAGGAVVAVLVFQSLTPHTLTVLGASALFGGVGLTLVAVAASSTIGVFAGTAVAGIGFGSGFQGVMRTVLPLAAPHERAGVLSAVFVVSYLSMGLPAVVGGWLVVHSGGLVATACEYGAAVMVLAAAALVEAVRPRRRTGRTAAATQDADRPVGAEAPRAREELIRVS